MPLTPGQRLGDYEIIGILGSGGMGHVYRARDMQLGRDVAIKVLGEETGRDPAGVRRLLAEARAASALNHPNILTVHAIGDAAGSPYVVMELVDGQTLRAILQHGPLPPEHAVDIALQVLAGLVKAHGIGLVHRDLKPENLMLTSDGIVKILDFGLAKLVDPGAGPRPLDTLGAAPTATGLVVGTASYMSPEQARGQAADARSDVFSFGVVLYEMLTGQNPFRRSTIADTVSALLRDQPPRVREVAPHLPAELGQCVDRLIEKDPAARPASALEVERDLAAVRESLRGLSPTPRPRHPGLDRVLTGPGARTSGPIPAGPGRRRAVLVAASAGVLLTAVLCWLYLDRARGDRAAPPSPFQPGSQVVAVMSIEDRTGDADLARADVGRILSDAFVQILYDCRGIQVVSPVRIQSLVASDKRSFADTGRDGQFARSVCRRAGANTVLSGALSRLGETLVLNATLTDMSSGKLLGSFETQADGGDRLLEALSADIAPMVKQALGRAMGVEIAGGRPVGEIMTPNFEAYRHLTRGSDFNTAGNFEAALPELQKAVAIDSSLGVAWSELSCAYSFSGDEANANAASKRALALRARMSRKESLWVEANSLWLTGDGPRYREHVKTFLGEFPDDRQALLYMGLSYEWLDKDCSQAIAMYEKAYQLTPEYWPITKGLADCAQKLGDPRAARRAIERYLRVVNRGYGSEDARRYLESLRGGQRG